MGGHSPNMGQCKPSGIIIWDHGCNKGQVHNFQVFKLFHIQSDMYFLQLLSYALEIGLSHHGVTVA